MIRAAALALALAACSEPAPTVIDGGSPEAFERTVKDARRDLSDADRLAFDRALAGIPARRYGTPDAAAAARTAFDGLTAAEVVAQQREREKLP